MSAAGRNVVILSGFHDYRTAKRGSIQQVADGFVRAGYDVSFVSTRFSWVSRITKDSRLFLWNKANRVETVNGIRCYLWRTAAHPFQSKKAWLSAIMGRLYAPYAALPDRQFDAFLRDADYIVVESSIAAIYIRRAKRINPSAKIIYYATDRLDTVGAHAIVREQVARDAALIDHVCLRSPRMMPEFAWARGRLYRAEFGIDPIDVATIGVSPYPPNTTTVVSVGSMLFDPSFFQLAAPRFPDVQFHVIGCGTTFPAPANVHIHPEMRFAETLPFVKHATIGVAPYRPAPGVEYLADSSLKIAQYEYFGLPVVCPAFAVGEAVARCGYVPGDATSIGDAITSALARVGDTQPRSFHTWDEVAERVLQPTRFAGTAIG